jgi:protein tyrosine/serine phosphatase
MPWIDLDGAVNARDLGGLPTEDGAATAPGRLLRSDNLQELTPADVRRLVRDIGVTTVVDLRSSSELAAEGPAPLDAVAGVRHAHHPLTPETALAAETAAEALQVWQARRERERTQFPDDPVIGRYLGYLEFRPDQVTGALRSIAQDPGAAIVHCAAGRDRTGVIVALALTAAGVRPEAVIADYVATGDRAAAILDRIRRSSTYDWDVDRMPPERYRPRPETMAAFLDQMTVCFGGVTAWLTGNGMLPIELDQLRAKLRS